MSEQVRLVETTESIGRWAADTFGEAGTDARVAARANEEMAELLRKVTSENPRSAEIIEECADVAIVLARLVYRNGGQLWTAVEAKMAVNRAREWELDGTGHGYHVKHSPAVPATALGGG